MLADPGLIDLLIIVMLNDGFNFCYGGVFATNSCDGNLGLCELLVSF